MARRQACRSADESWLQHHLPGHCGSIPSDEKGTQSLVAFGHRRSTFAEHFLSLQKVNQLQMNKAAQLYLITYQLVWEDKQHQKFWTQWGKCLLYATHVGIRSDCFPDVRACRDTLTSMKAELVDVVLKAGHDWEVYHKKVEDFLVDWEKHNAALLRYLLHSASLDPSRRLISCVPNPECRRMRRQRARSCVRTQRS